MTVRDRFTGWSGIASVSLLLCSVLPAAAQYSTPRAQWGLEYANEAAVAVTYAHRLEESRLLMGFGVGFAWEWNDHSFDRQVWNVFHVEGFARYQPLPFFQGEGGVSLSMSSPTDDTNASRGFFGLYGAAMVGYRYLFFGPQVRAGYLDNEFGTIRTFAVRAVLPLGR